MKCLDSVKIIVKSPSHKYLLLRSSEWPDNPDRSLQPDLPGGLVDDGEDFATASIRELKEETGLSVKSVKLIYATAYISNIGDSVNRLFFYVEVNKTDIKLSWEHCEYWWADLDEFCSSIKRNNYPEVFEYLRKNKILT